MRKAKFHLILSTAAVVIANGCAGDVPYLDRPSVISNVKTWHFSGNTLTIQAEIDVSPRNKYIVTNLHGTRVAQRIELDVTDTPSFAVQPGSALATCVINDVPEGRYSVVATQTGKELTTIDTKQLSSSEAL